MNSKVGITKYKDLFSKVYTENWSGEIFAIDSVLKLNSWTNKIKDFKEEIIIGSFHEKNFLLSKF